MKMGPGGASWRPVNKMVREARRGRLGGYFLIAEGGLICIPHASMIVNGPSCESRLRSNLPLGRRVRMSQHDLIANFECHRLVSLW